MVLFSAGLRDYFLPWKSRPYLGLSLSLSLSFTSIGYGVLPSEVERVGICYFHSPPPPSYGAFLRGLQLGLTSVGSWCEIWNININEQYKQLKYDVKLSCVRVHTFCSCTAISSTYYECVFLALVIQHAKRMRHILLSSVASLAVYFSTFF